MSHSSPSSRTEVEGSATQPPLQHGEIDLEGQTLKGETRRPVTIPMPRWLQPYVAEGCGIAVMVIIGLITNM